MQVMIMGESLRLSYSLSDTSSGSSELTRRTMASTNMSTAIFRPRKPLVVPRLDVNIDLQRRSNDFYTGFAMIHPSYMSGLMYFSTAND
jgi:hypothetical protein